MKIKNESRRNIIIKGKIIKPKEEAEVEFDEEILKLFGDKISYEKNKEVKKNVTLVRKSSKSKDR